MRKQDEDGMSANTVLLSQTDCKRVPPYTYKIIDFTLNSENYSFTYNLFDD